MRYRKIGASGLAVSEIALGSWLTYGGSVAEDTAIACARRAFELGVNYFDTADAYAKGEAERVLAKALAPFPRHHLVIATKAFWPQSDDPNDRGLSRKHVIESVERSLRRLQTDYVDIFYCHRFDPQTPLDETLRAIDDLVAQGKVLYGAISEWPAEQVSAAQAAQERLGLRRLIADQVQYNLLDPKIEADVLPRARAAGMGIVAFSPLAQGVLTGKYLGGQRPAGSRGADERTARMVADYLEGSDEKVQRLQQVAKAAGLTPPQLALRWVLRLPEVSSALVGASSVAQLEENLGAADEDLSQDVLRQVQEALGS
ncbi:MAG: aldo/keto reductase family protein [Thermaerobacter sp.]|nr:aldo/keto reductase family protein [Thermaerobacter sp.]